MKNLLRILAGGFVAFMLLAVGQEWDFFSSAWFGKKKPAPTLSADDRRGASQALYAFLKISSHFFASAGDPRFAERLPASDGVVAELRDEVEYLRKNTRLQDPQLVRLEVAAAEPLSEGRVELRTREWWHVRTLWIADGTPSDPPRAFRAYGRYLLAKPATGWRVEGWQPLDQDPAPGPPGEAISPDPRPSTPPAPPAGSAPGASGGR